MKKVAAKTNKPKKAKAGRQCWPQTPEAALENGGGMYGTISSDELPFGKRFEYVKKSVHEITSNPASDYDRVFLLHPLETAVEWLREGDYEGAAMVFFELGRRVERHYAVAFDSVAKKGLANTRQNRENAPKGGKATAHYSDLVFESAFCAYRKKNPTKNAWDAANSLTRQGQHLDKLKAGSAYKRAERIAERLAITVDDWFQSLA